MSAVEVSNYSLASLQQLECVAVDVAQIGADFVRAAAGKAIAAGTKTTATDVVTHTDIECENLIRTELLRRCPGSTIVGEEFDDAVGANNVGWIVDPIDGTVNYLYDLPVVSVSIAGTINGEVVAGAVADVHRQQTFSATVGGGARRDGVDVSANVVEDLSVALIGTGFAYDSALRSLQAEVITTVLPECRDIRCMGSAALNLCWVGSGKLDGYFERDLKLYDYAAGALVAAEGGAICRVPKRSGATSDLSIAASSPIFDQLLALVD